MLWILVAVLLMIRAVMYRWKNRKLIALGNQLASKDIALPLVGHSYLFLGDDEDRMEICKRTGEEAYKKDGLIAQWQGQELFVFVADPEAAEVILKKCLAKVDIMRLLRVLIGNGSIFAPVSIWRPRRKVLAPTFSQKNLNSFVEVFSRQSIIMVDQLRTAAGKGAFSIWKYLTTYTMDSVCETTLGIQMNSQMEPDVPFLHAFENCCRLDAKRVFQPWLHNDTMNKIFGKGAFESYARSKEFIWKFMHKIIASKSEELKREKLGSDSSQAQKGSWKSFLQLLIESPAGYSDVELREETLVIVLAGTDTSAVGAAFTTVMLAKYPDIQEKVYQELQEVFGNSDRPATYEDLPRLKYLEAVIKETMRLYPPVPFITRKVENDITMPSGVTLFNGVNIIISIWAIHRNPRYWGEDAELFRPERFIDTPLKHPLAFIPFSHGARSCLGYQYAMMSMKTALSTLLRRYRVVESEEKNNASEAKNDASEANNDTSRAKLRVKFGIMLKHVHNYEVQLELRT